MTVCKRPDGVAAVARAAHCAERTRVILEAQHPVGDDGEEERLNEVVRQLNQALGDGEGQLVIHARRAFSVHHLRRHGSDELLGK